MSLQLLDPTTEPIVEPGVPAQRLESLEGKTIGRYDNTKLNARELMDLVEERLRRDHGVAEIVRGTYHAGRVMRPDEWKEVERCDAIMLTHGD